MTIKRGTTVAMINLQQRRERELQLRIEGHTLQEIADIQGVSKATVCDDIHLCIEAITAEPARDVLALELDRLDAMLQGIWGKARNGDCRAAETVLHIMERRARFLGLDAPTRSVAAFGVIPQPLCEVKTSDIPIERQRAMALEQVQRLHAEIASSDGAPVQG